MSRIFPSRRGGVLITRIVGWLVSAIAILALMIAGIGPAVVCSTSRPPARSSRSTVVLVRRSRPRRLISWVAAARTSRSKPRSGSVRRITSVVLTPSA